MATRGRAASISPVGDYQCPKCHRKTVVMNGRGTATCLRRGCEYQESGREGWRCMVAGCGTTGVQQGGRPTKETESWRHYMNTHHGTDWKSRSPGPAGFVASPIR